MRERAEKQREGGMKGLEMTEEAGLLGRGLYLGGNCPTLLGSQNL